MKINLIISLYNVTKTERYYEFVDCLKRNIDNTKIDKIIVLNEGFDCDLLQNKKISVIEFQKRPSYKDFLPFFETGKINIISNSDIYFDNSLLNLKYLKPKKRKVFVLTRYEKDGILFNKTGNSHDSWVFYGRPLALESCDFYLGIPNCEQRLIAVLSDNDYYILNPSKYIKSYHLHNSQDREYYQSGAIYSGTGLLIKPLGLIGTWLLFAVLRTLRVNNILKRRMYLEDGSVFDKWE